MTLSQIVAASYSQAHIYRMNIGIRGCHIACTDFNVSRAIAKLDGSHISKCLHIIVGTNLIHIDACSTHAHSVVDCFRGIFILSTTGQCFQSHSLGIEGILSTNIYSCLALGFGGHNAAPCSYSTHTLSGNYFILNDCCVFSLNLKLSSNSFSLHILACSKAVFLTNGLIHA